MVRKIGRNDPCPCGSGKKYKKCCLLKEDIKNNIPEIILADAASLRMNYLLSKIDRSKFMRAYKSPAMSIEKSVLATMPPSPSKNESEKALLLWKQRLEEEIKRLCANHSKYYWLHLARRIFPMTIEPYDRPTTPYLHHTTFQLAVLKYGNINQGEEFVAVPSSFNISEYICTEAPYKGKTVDLNKADQAEKQMSDELEEMIRPTIIPRQITQKDAINIYQIEYLALDYYRITSQLRRLWKGGKLRVQKGRFAGVDLPKRVEDLVALYDQRQSKYHELLSSFGSITNLEMVREKESLDNFVIFIPTVNIERHKIPLVFPEEEFLGGRVKGPIYTKDNPTNFVIIPVSLQPCYQKMCMFRKAIKNVFKFSPEELISFIITLDRHNLRFWMHNIQSRYSFFQRGYETIPSTKEFCKYLARIYKDIYKQLFGKITLEQASSFCGQFLSFMSYERDDFKNISLWDRTGVKLFLPVPQGLLADHSAIPAVLASIFSELALLASTDGQIGQMRGDDFEKEVEKYLEVNIHDFHPWVCHRKLRFLSGTERDIDVSFLSGSVLFVIECKAFSVPPAFDRGEPDALQARKDKIDYALNQAVTLCQLLSKERKGKNFEIPGTATHIISIVASPFPEYVDTRSDRYFLTPSIPRVCTPEEIAEFVRQFKLPSHISKPFVWEVS
ncbi:hypothetical protein ES703_49924 [subsurface metagenome]